jgi:hypothetical protein
VTTLVETPTIIIAKPERAELGTHQLIWRKAMINTQELESVDVKEARAVLQLLL